MGRRLRLRRAGPGRRVNTETLFQAASLTKPVSAVVAAAAAEEGLIDLESDALELTTSWRHPSPWWDGPITLRMLLAHRGGVNVHGFPGYQMNEQLPELAVILDGVLDRNEPIRVVTEPGERKYSGGGFLIAELAIEDHTGVDFEVLADRLVLDPLEMVSSTYELLSVNDRPRVAVGFREDGSEVPGGGWHLYPETASAALWTTPREYSAFIIDVMRSYHSDSGVILERDTAELLLDPDFAVGFGVSREPSGIAIGHDGANEGYRSEFVALPELGIGVVVMTNSNNGLALTADVIDAVAVEMGWPSAGWSTPLWAVLMILVASVGAGTLFLRQRIRRRSAFTA